MSCARRVSFPGCPPKHCDGFNPLIPPTHNCYEQEAAEVDKAPCVWGQCPGKDCLQYDCFGDFNMAKYRPKCSLVVAPPRKECKSWCYSAFGNVLPHCGDPCPKSRWVCTEPEPPMPPKAPWRQQGCPLFLWSHGYATLNIKNELYPEANEGLKFKERVKESEEKIDSREVELWSLTAMPKGSVPPLWKTLGQRTPWACRPRAPLTLWSDGHPKSNVLRQPYPGHGFKLFDSCHPCNRKSFPPQRLPRNINGVFSPPKALCGTPYCV